MLGFGTGVTHFRPAWTPARLLSLAVWTEASGTIDLPAGLSATSTAGYARPETGAEILTVDLSGDTYTPQGEYHVLVLCDGQLSSADQARLTQFLDGKAGV